MREVSEAELARFQQQLQEAALSLDSREERVAAVYSGLEVGLTLLGATAVEDRLQEEVGTCCALIGQQSPHCAAIGQVGDTLRWLRLGGVKVWVLTGDKKETAVNICYASGHLQPGTRLLDLTGLPPALLPASLASHAAQTRAEDSCGLIVDGDTVAGVVASTQNTQLFVEVGQPSTLKIYICHFPVLHILQLSARCSAVVCCRLSPLQKSELIKLMRSSPGRPVTAAIGDGGNDVSMIQEAHIGFGIMGREGRAAARASDIAFAKFKHLKKVIFVHGQWYYYR